MIRHITQPQFPAENYLNREIGLLAFQSPRSGPGSG
jgi:hypothetical protein